MSSPLLSDATLADLDAQAADLRTQIAPLQQRLREVLDQRRLYLDMLAEEAEDEQVFASLRHESRIAFAKLTKRVRATTHDAIFDFCDSLPVEGAAFTEQDYRMGPSLIVERIPTDAEGVEALAESMCDFAARFCTPAPQQWDWPSVLSAGVDAAGMVYASVLAPDCGEQHSWQVFYAPEGERAYLLDARMSRDVCASGSLVEVLAALRRLASQWVPSEYQGD